MATREDLESWLTEALRSMGGSGTIVAICKYVWDRYHTELEGSGQLFYTWQYDIRWAANRLRRRRIMKSVETSPKGMWELT